MSADVQQPGNRAVATVAATASLAALACGVCCVLPLALPAVVLGSVGGVLAWFASAYSWMTPLTIAAVIGGWIWVADQSRRSRKPPARSTLVIMTFATLMMVLAFLWPEFEGPLTNLLQ